MYSINDEVVIVDKTKAIASPGTLGELFELNNFAGVRPENGVVGIVRDKTYHPTMDNCIIYVVEAIGTVVGPDTQVDKVMQYLVREDGLSVPTQFYVNVRIQVTASDADQALSNVVPLIASKFTVIESYVEAPSV